MINFNNVIYSCVSYRRNIKDMLFVNKLSDFEQAIAISRSMSEIFEDMLEFKSLKNIPLLECQKMQENGMFTKELIENKDISAYAIDGLQEKRVLVNEQDHVRIIVQKKGLNLDDCFCDANKMDDMLLDKLEMAFDNNLGYLTANPKLVGTGMEAMVCVFVPALTFGGKLKNSIGKILNNEFEILNFDGEKWNEKCPFVLIKNIYTFGNKENEIAEKLQKIVEKILELEKLEDNNQFNLSASTLVDNIFRAYGDLTNAYRICEEEAQEKLGYVLWGINLKALTYKKKFDFYSLLGKIKENNLGKMENIKETEKARAKFLSSCLANSIVKGEVDV